MRGSTRSSSRLVALALALLAGACAAPPRPAADVVEAARATKQYSAEIGVRLRGPDLRARTNALIAFERPARLRIEVPGPSGARFVLVARGDELTAVFPAEHAIYVGGTTAREIEALLGVALVPHEIMELLLGSAPARLAEYRAWWGPRFPEKVDARLADGTRLQLRIRGVEAGVSLPAAAFEPPSSQGYRRVDAAEARRLWSAR